MLGQGIEVLCWARGYKNCAGSYDRSIVLGQEIEVLCWDRGLTSISIFVVCVQKVLILTRNQPSLSVVSKVEGTLKEI